MDYAPWLERFRKTMAEFASYPQVKFYANTINGPAPRKEVEAVNAMCESKMPADLLDFYATAASSCDVLYCCETGGRIPEITGPLMGTFIPSIVGGFHLMPFAEIPDTIAKIRDSVEGTINMHCGPGAAKRARKIIRSIFPFYISQGSTFFSYIGDNGLIAPGIYLLFIEQWLNPEEAIYVCESFVTLLSFLEAHNYVELEDSLFRNEKKFTPNPALAAEIRQFMKKPL